MASLKFLIVIALFSLDVWLRLDIRGYGLYTASEVVHRTQELNLYLPCCSIREPTLYLFVGMFIYLELRGLRLLLLTVCLSTCFCRGLVATFEHRRRNETNRLAVDDIKYCDNNDKKCNYSECK